MTDVLNLSLENPLLITIYQCIACDKPLHLIVFYTICNIL